MTEPSRPRAVFSIDDFRLIRTALSHYLATAKDDPELGKYASLYHRLGRVDDSPPTKGSF